MKNPAHAASLNCSVIDDCPRKGILIERDATDADHIDGGVYGAVEFDPATNRLQEWICIAEAEHLELIAPDDAARLRTQAEAVKAKKVAA